MGLFSKKTYVCDKCGKEYEKRININGKLCDECSKKEAAAQEELKKHIGGYCNYRSAMSTKKYTSEEMQEILNHRNALLEKFKFSEGISRDELRNASDNYKNLTDEEAKDVLTRAAKASVTGTTGAVYTDSFFVLTDFAGIIVDVEDVFAVGYTTDRRMNDANSESILCVVFTNDPYVPVFPMIYVGKKRLFEVSKSKKGREGVSATFDLLCPNLKYPVCDLKELKKIINKEDSVKGNMDQIDMLMYISSATSNSGIFDSKNMYSTLMDESAKMLDSIGYIQDREIDRILKMDKMLNRKYWNKQLQKISE